VPTIKPLDEATILDSVNRTGRVVTAEEAQAAGGFGGAVAELLCEKSPAPLHRVGMRDRFGESGEPEELMRYFGFTADSMFDEVKAFIEKVPQYKPGF
jgi:transketolase